ncbi:hypothetical protein [Geomicrobium sp. JCM 19055]|uniref:hypothetical protein n=1 Tax=Geomicrobium sp. JCM 19055 TaxID=1460649 RepID=UPI0005AA885E|nr:hypothetical protein [Geomicrobium sp. JCM 19055]
MKPFLLLLCCILLAGSAQTTLFIEIRHAITKETFTIQQLSEDDELKLSWIHSVEKNPLGRILYDQQTRETDAQQNTISIIWCRRLSIWSRYDKY